MLPQHWFMFAVVAGVFYLIGARYPAGAQRLGF